MQGRVHSTESFGSADGPGVRYIVFLQGCPMRCRYCHNPDTWKAGAGELMDADEILDAAERYRGYWGPEGGITVSGGEALMQVDFVAELFEKAHARGINTCLDTSLSTFTREEPFFSAFERAMEACDLVMADIKHIDPERHEWLCGRDNDNILDCLRLLAEKGQPADFATVLADIRQRDYQDSHRAVAPLKQADDAILVDTSSIGLQESFDLLKRTILAHI